jgi:hypothetical protein
LRHPNEVEHPNAAGIDIGIAAHYAIEGVAIIIGKTPDLLLLSVRLPPELDGLTSAIVARVEPDAR